MYSLRVSLYQIHFEKYVSDFLVFWSIFMSKIRERKNNKTLRGPLEPMWLELSHQAAQFSREFPKAMFKS